ncbi:DUF6435 family protein [Stratiformator vulcanicus]|uniref:Lacal_2735 family protein n=1 Tax=Stratiformator vulcanicus TaxID=2527980 RepID=A0A517R426_9PLAN|nr:DUF6435 family protein [Stratiformator vulcanicus]QDT38621.1 hypothetical protein Pan189_30160 [Stratiformator vulcanicus]
MFGLFKTDPIAKLRKEYMRKMEEARDIQRNGDVVKASQLTAEAEEIGRRIDELEAQAKS